jgi:uncharacterized membrane protein
MASRPLGRLISWSSVPIIGALVGVASFTPASTLVRLVRSSAVESDVLLLDGARCFKTGLVVLAAYVFVLTRLQRRHSGEARATIDSQPACSMRDRVCLLAIVAMAAALRLYQLEGGPWLDEITSYVRYVRIPIGVSLTTYDTQNQHLLYTSLAKLSLAVFGDSVWSLRLPAVAAGLASIVLLFGLSARLRSSREALLAAALLAVSYHHVWFSQNARGYTMLLTLTLAATWLFVEGLERDTPRLWTMYAVTAALGIYTHLTMLCVVSAQFFIYLWTMAHGAGTRRKSAHGFWFGFGLTAVLTGVLYAFVLPQMFAGALEEGTGGAIAVWSSPLWGIAEILDRMRVGYRNAAVLAAVAALAAVGGARLLLDTPTLVALATLPIAITAAVVVGSGHHVWPRFFFFASGFAVMAVIAGTTAAGEWASARLRLRCDARLAGTTIALALIAISSVAVPGAYGPKQDYAGARDFVESARLTGDAVAVVGVVAEDRLYQDYYATDWTVVESFDDFERIRAAARRTWLVYTLPIELEAMHPKIAEAIENGFEVVRRFPGTLNDGDVVVCRSIETARGASSHRGA